MRYGLDPIPGPDDFSTYLRVEQASTFLELSLAANMLRMFYGLYCMDYVSDDCRV